MLVRRLDPFTGQRNVMDLPITEQQMQDWRSGVLIQDAMPNLDDDQREFVMTGIMPDTWDELFLLDEGFDSEYPDPAERYEELHHDERENENSYDAYLNREDNQ